MVLKVALLDLLGLLGRLLESTLSGVERSESSRPLARKQALNRPLVVLKGVPSRPPECSDGPSESNLSGVESLPSSLDAPYCADALNRTFEVLKDEYRTDAETEEDIL